MPRHLPAAKKLDPRRRYIEIRTKERSPETAAEIALDAILQDSDYAGDPAVMEAVQAAYMSFVNPDVRNMFDACLLGRATPDDLAVFGVSAAEAVAYIELFFDRKAFPNDFHALAWIAQEPNPDIRELLRKGFAKGVRALQFEFAAVPKDSLQPETAIQAMMQADVQRYMANQAMPLTAKGRKELATIGKQVLAAGQVLTKIGIATKTAQADSKDEGGDFVLESGPLNPTLEELLSKGVELAT